MLLLLVLSAGTIITLSYRDQANRVTAKLKTWAGDVFKPIETGFSDAFDPVGHFFRGAFDYGSLRDQNARLRQQLGALRRQKLVQADTQRQLRDLLALDHLPFAATLPNITAEVIDTNFSNFQLSVQLNRGTAAGVEVGMPVVSGAGLVGRVIQTGTTTSTVLLLTDPTSNIGVRDAGAVGVASGQGQGDPLRIDYVPPGQPVHKGDVMVTSGLQGALFPPGIPVGQVSLALTPPDSLQEELAMRPVTDLANLQFVDVLKWRPAQP